MIQGMIPAAALDSFQVKHLAHWSTTEPSFVPIFVKSDPILHPSSWPPLEIVEESQAGDVFYANPLVDCHGVDFDFHPADRRQGLSWAMQSPLADEILLRCEALPDLEADIPEARFLKNEPIRFAGFLDDVTTSSSGSVVEDCCDFDQIMAPVAPQPQIFHSLGGSSACPSSWFGSDQNPRSSGNEDLEAALGNGTSYDEPPKKLLKTSRIEAREWDDHDQGFKRKNKEEEEEQEEELDQESDLHPAEKKRSCQRSSRQQQQREPWSSIDPQSVAARRRRKRISERVRWLEKLIPGGSKMDTASMLGEAIRYVKFLQLQVELLEMIGGGDEDHHRPPNSPLVLSEELQEVLFRKRCCVAAIKQST
ncbi:uncharacterized protein LOC112344658 [Selaginella moellendorffii]|uniref:uncharacterized protein LOC112344658 n=1 Tax=Selaginella moellendorffii TaxID=88036 RepID=UPI000D1C2B0A|nr:uncharacterized protein LOC112344658 [Selaginella moellendorffii]|eukprot:XP_024525610.1 uncharacterized protein LOC112344658 [Selaginella moellendorffii]